MEDYVLMKQFIIDIAEDGSIKIESRGFVGKSCVDEAQFLKDLLGKEISNQLTAAYFSTEKTVIKKHLTLCG
jgi:hypothetical protein